MATTTGESPVSTSSDDAVTLLDVGNLRGLYELTIVNEGTAGGYWSLDGTNWRRLPPGPSSIKELVAIEGNIAIKREASGTDLTDMHCWIDRPQRIG